ncbi:MAG: hypothetical protein IID45_04020 [Planctomycetes bacterium]|nr:hypothetical protein [Planctomycetota bacterium]
MSTMRADKTKIVLPRTEPDEFWELVQKHYAGCNSRRWKYLAMLALKENAGWPLQQIATAFSHSRGHVQRSIEQIKQELRERFRVSPGHFESSDSELPTRDPQRRPAGRSEYGFQNPNQE